MVPPPIFVCLLAFFLQKSFIFESLQIGSKTKFCNKRFFFLSLIFSPFFHPICLRCNQFYTETIIVARHVTILSFSFLPYPSLSLYSFEIWRVCHLHIAFAAAAAAAVLQGCLTIDYLIVLLLARWDSLEEHLIQDSEGINPEQNAQKSRLCFCSEIF